VVSGFFFFFNKTVYMPERRQIVTNTKTQQISHVSVTLLTWTRHFKQNKYSTGCTWRG